MPDYNDKKGKVIMIDPFIVEDPSKVPVVDQSVRPHLYQDVHGLIRTSSPPWQKNAQARPSNPNQAPYDSQQNCTA